MCLCVSGPFRQIHVRGEQNQQSLRVSQGGNSAGEPLRILKSPTIKSKEAGQIPASPAADLSTKQQTKLLEGTLEGHVADFHNKSSSTLEDSAGSKHPTSSASGDVFTPEGVSVQTAS